MRALQLLLKYVFILELHFNFYKNGLHGDDT